MVRKLLIEVRKIEVNFRFFTTSHKCLSETIRSHMYLTHLLGGKQAYLWSDTDGVVLDLESVI